MAGSGADPELVAAWIRGWALCKETATPFAIDGGWRVEVGWPDQAARLVFPSLCDGLVRAGEQIAAPWTWLKVCATADELRPLLPPPWQVEQRGVMMTTPTLPDGAPVLPDGYRIAIEDDGVVALARVLTADGEQAAWGRVARSDGFAVFDRIATEDAHRRRGLATAVMAALRLEGRRRGARGGLLVGTDMGRRLYESLGWTVLSPYTSAVISGDQARNG